MKKILALAVVAVMAMLMLTGCGKKKVEYVVLDDVLKNEEYAIGFRKEDQALRDEVQKALCDMKKDGKVAEITKKWFGNDISTVPDNFTPTETSDDSLKKIKENKKLVMGLDDSFPPMGYDKDGEIVGYDIDLAKEVCSRMGVELKLQPVDWDNKELELKQGNIDCIWNGMSVDNERKEAMNLSEPYMENRQVVVTLKRNKINKLTDLANKTVILQKESTAVKALDSRKDIKSTVSETVEVMDNVLAMFELRQGTGDAVVMDEVVARYYIAHMAELDSKANAE